MVVVQSRRVIPESKRSLSAFERVSAANKCGSQEGTGRVHIAANESKVKQNIDKRR